LPDAVEPVLIKIDPDVPNDAAFEVDTVTEPVVLLLLLPAMMDKEPPVCDAAVVAPADSTNTPPVPLFPEPTTTLMAPPLPLVAKPDCNVIEPELPTNVVPLLNRIEPDTPEDAAFGLTI